MAALNALLSPFAVYAGSDRALTIVDWHTGQQVSRKLDAQSRPCHSVALPDTSVHSAGSLTIEYNYLLSAACHDGIVLWDTRSWAEVLRLNVHPNRRFSVRPAMSPCQQYVATGAEDQVRVRV